MGAAQIHNIAIDLDHVEMPHARMAQTFAGGAAITAADHQHALDRFGTAEGGMDQRFVIVTLLPLGRHPAAIQQQCLAVALTADQCDPLEWTGLFHQHLTGESITDLPMFLIHPNGHGDPTSDCLQLTPQPGGRNASVSEWCRTSSSTIVL